MNQIGGNLVGSLGIRGMVKFGEKKKPQIDLDTMSLIERGWLFHFKGQKVYLNLKCHHPI